MKTAGNPVSEIVPPARVGVGWQDIDGAVFDSRIIFSPWKKGSFFEESDDVPPFTVREARQLAHVLLAMAEEVEGWAAS